MAIRAPSSRPLLLPHYTPSAALRDRYQAELVRHLRGLAKKVHAALSEAMPDGVGMALDAQIVDPFSKIFSRSNKKWLAEWVKNAPRSAESLVIGMATHADRQFESSLKHAGFSVKFRPTPALRQKIMQATQYNTSLIKSVGSEYLDQVEKLVTQSALKGGDAATLAKNLRERFGVAKSRSALIARDQNAKVTALVTNERRAENGLYYARWHHSAGVDKPRPDHLAAGLKKLIFDVRKGAYLEGKWVQPGDEINCHCSSSTIIPALEKVDPAELLKAQQI